MINMKQPLNEGYTYTRGNQTNVKPVEIHQSRKPVPKGISATFNVAAKSQVTVTPSIHPQREYEKISVN